MTAEAEKVEPKELRRPQTASEHCASPDLPIHPLARSRSADSRRRQRAWSGECALEGGPPLVGTETEGTLSMYLLFGHAHVLALALRVRDGDGASYAAAAQRSELLRALAAAARAAGDELCRQLAYHCAGDKAKFDSTQLAYALLAHLTLATATTGAGDVGGCEGGGGESLPRANMKLVEKALEIVFGEQMDDGLWPAGGPTDPVGASWAVAAALRQMAVREMRREVVPVDPVDKLRADVGNRRVNCLE
jgi:hypothetical protein